MPLLGGLSVSQENEVEKISVVRDHRVETGVIQFNDDWPGVFIRGDDCRGFAMAIKTLLEGRTDRLVLMELDSLGRLLDSSCVGVDIRLWRDANDKPA
jgi:hypothetical protein